MKEIIDFFFSGSGIAAIFIFSFSLASIYMISDLIVWAGVLFAEIFILLVHISIWIFDILVSIIHLRKPNFSTENIYSNPLNIKDFKNRNIEKTAKNALRFSIKIFSISFGFFIVFKMYDVSKISSFWYHTSLIMTIFFYLNSSMLWYLNFGRKLFIFTHNQHEPD